MPVAVPSLSKLRVMYEHPRFEQDRGKWFVWPGGEADESATEETVASTGAAMLICFMIGNCNSYGAASHLRASRIVFKMIESVAEINA